MSEINTIRTAVQKRILTSHTAEQVSDLSIRLGMSFNSLLNFAFAEKKVDPNSPFINEYGQVTTIVNSAKEIGLIPSRDN